MKAIRYYRRNASGTRIPLYMEGPFWAHYTINVLDALLGFCLRWRTRIERKYLTEEDERWGIGATRPNMD